MQGMHKFSVITGIGQYSWFFILTYDTDSLCEDG